MIAVRRIVVAAVLLSAFAIAGRQARAQSVRIEPKHKAGETNYIEQNIEVTQKIEGGQIPGGSMEIGVNRVYGLTEKLEPASDGGAQIAMTFDRTMQKIDSPFMSGAFDSDIPDEEESPMIAAPLKAMVGGTFKMEIDKEGKVKEFSGMKGILEKVEEVAGGNPFMMQLRNELTDERGRSMYGEQLYLMYPNKEVSVGDTWAKTYHDVIPQVGKVISHYDYKLDRVGDENGRKVAMVSFTSKTEKDPSGKPVGEMPGMASSKVDGAAKGLITYDVDRGMVTKQVSDGHMNLEMGRGGAAKKQKEEEKAEKDGGKTKVSKDEDDDDEDQPKPMKINIALKQTYTVLTTADRAKQKTEAAVKAKASQEKDDAKAKPKKNAKKPVKKADDDDDD